VPRLTRETPQGRTEVGACCLVLPRAIKERGTVRQTAARCYARTFPDHAEREREPASWPHHTDRAVWELDHRPPCLSPRAGGNEAGAVSPPKGSHAPFTFLTSKTLVRRSGWSLLNNAPPSSGVRDRNGRDRTCDILLPKQTRYRCATSRLNCQGAGGGVTQPPL
jgi:hypothetical protein